MSAPERFRDLGLAGSYQATDDRLNRFYVPVLRLATRYDRMVGYWRSSSLTVAAAGLVRFFHNAREVGGTMRVIAGADLTDQDVAAIDGGAPIDGVLAERMLLGGDATDVVVQHRLGVLAWLVQHGMLEIKVGIPVDTDGRLLKPAEAGRYFHTKAGILTDAFGDRIAFVGSSNESASGWRYNHEGFLVFRSWDRDEWERFGQPWADQFEEHWKHPHPTPEWKIVDLPEAARANLLRQLPPDPTEVLPARDPGEETVPPEAVGELERVRHAPTDQGGTGVAFVTTPIEPWLHQESIASRILATWPRSYMLSDEVGLGKTIEAGLVIRELLLTGKAERILILVPASVQRQWQEELFEKFCLDIPSLTKGRFKNYVGLDLALAGANPWSQFPVMLASSHLARLRRHRDLIRNAAPWDLVLVDEAHHARRRGLGGQDSANQLLQLLRDMRDQAAWQAVILATATPMQMNTHEVFNLLDILGLPLRWGASPERFEAYYRQLAEEDPKARDWDLLRMLLADYFSQPDVAPNRYVADQVGQLAGPDQLLIHKLHSAAVAGPAIAAKPVPVRRTIDAWLRANTPLRDRVFRTTRAAIREYQRAGLLDPEKTTVPRRQVEDELIAFGSDEEAALYLRVEKYISKYYDAYIKDQTTKPLGFIMTVYRRRLTSSLYAVHNSLKRRLEGLREKAAIDDLLDDDDRYTLEHSAVFDVEDLEGDLAKRYGEEITELESFIGDLERFIPTDTKVQRLSDDIQQAFKSGHRTVLVFTQYTDTLDWLRGQLQAVYGAQIACYTGKGGSRWDPAAGEWKPLSKGEVKRLFREGTEVRILLGTDALSEGLNLETCDRLFNYDMPWNFMRVEQRIGRIDRIGGRPKVTVTNYFYKGTVEEQVYTGIAEDADWFTQVVGPAQPVLGQVEAVIQDLAMRAPGEARDAAVALEVAEVREAIAEAKRRPVQLSDLESEAGELPVRGYSAAPAITLDEIEQILVGNPLTAPHMHAHPDFPRTYYVEVGGQKTPATFDRDVYDKNPEIRFLTYGEPVFEGLVAVGIPRSEPAN